MCVMIYLHAVFFFIQYFQEEEKKNTINFVCVKSRIDTEIEKPLKGTSVFS
jgi:hypothetical protein